MIPIIMNRDSPDNFRNRVNVRAFSALLQDQRELPMANPIAGNRTMVEGQFLRFFLA